MRPPLARLAVPALLLSCVLGCKDNKTTTAPGAVANVMFNAPDSAKSGQSFTVDVNALNIGVNGIHNARVDVTVTAPLMVLSADSSSGTALTFSASSVSWMLGTLDSNSQARLHVGMIGTLPSGSAPQSLTLTAMLTADGINPGDATAHATIQLTP
jgi:uncharacterized protein DUF11